MLLIIKECLEAVFEVDIDDSDITENVLRISLMLGNNIYVKCNCEQKDWQKKERLHLCCFGMTKSLTLKAFIWNGHRLRPSLDTLVLTTLPLLVHFKVGISMFVWQIHHTMVLIIMSCCVNKSKQHDGHFQHYLAHVFIPWYKHRLINICTRISRWYLL